jgi:hypothetical protein
MRSIPRIRASVKTWVFSVPTFKIATDDGMVSYRFGAEGTKLALAITRMAVLHGPPQCSAMSATTSTLSELPVADQILAAQGMRARRNQELGLCSDQSLPSSIKQ